MSYYFTNFNKNNLQITISLLLFITFFLLGLIHSMNLSVSMDQTLVTKLLNCPQQQNTENYNTMKQKTIQQYNTVGVDTLISNFQNINIKYQIQSLQCLFTWQVKSQGNQDMITCIKNKYGDANLDISLPEFTFVK